MRRQTIIRVLCGVLVPVCGMLVFGACSGPPAATSVPPPAPLYFANWDGEIAADTIPEFKRRTGIPVVVDSITDNVSLQTKLLTGHSGYDVVVPSSNFLEPLIAAGALQKLDRAQLPNWQYLDPALLALVARIDPGNQYGVPYLWGTQAFAYNEPLVTQALGHAPEPSWKLLFDPDSARRLASCGIAWQDSAGSIMMHLGLLAIGRDPASERSEDLLAAELAFMRVRPYVHNIDSGGQFRSDLASGEICIATGASGELLQARDLAARAGRGPIRYVIPKEGALLWVDFLVIPANAPNTEAAHRFINYLMEPRVIAAVTNTSKFANANLAADPYVLPAVRQDPGIYPTPEERARLHLLPAESQAYSRERARAWSHVLRSGVN